MSNFFVNIPDDGTTGGPFLPLAGGTMTGSVNLGGHDITNGGRIGQGVTAHTLVEGETYTIDNSWVYVFFNGPSITTQTTHMPPNPISGQTVLIECIGGGIANWTLDSPGGNLFAGAPLPTSISAGQAFQFVFVALGPGFWILASRILNIAYLPLAGGELTGPVSFSPDNTVALGSPDAGATLERPSVAYVGTGIELGAGNADAYNPYLNFGAPTDDFYASIVLDTTVSGNLIINGDAGVQVVPTLITNAIQATGLSATTYATGGVGGSTMLVADEGTLNIDTSAIFEAKSTTKGVLFPRVSTTEKNAIASPATGLVVYDTDLNKLCLYTGAGWETVASV